MWKRIRQAKWLVAVLTVGVLVVGYSAAADARGAVTAEGDTVVQTQDVDGSFYGAGSTIQVAGAVNGDVYVAGQSVTITGDIEGDVLVAAQTVTISGTVEGNVRVAAQTITVTGSVTGSITALAQTFTLTDTASIGRDAVIAAQLAVIDGTIERDVQAVVGQLNLSGTIGRDVAYASENDLSQSADATVGGVVERTDTSRQMGMTVGRGDVVWAILYMVVSLTLVMLAAGLLVPRWLHEVTDQAVPTPWKALLVGFIAAVAAPVALILLAVTVVGAPLALAGLVLWFAVLLIGTVLGAYYLGRLVLGSQQRPLTTSVAGGVLFVVLLLIPLVNLLVWLVATCIGIGAQLLEFNRRRPYHAAIPATAKPRIQKTKTTKK